MKDGLRFVDCDMHVMEPPDLFDRYLDPAFRDRVVCAVGSDGKPARGMIVIDGEPTSILKAIELREERPDGARSDRAGGWIVPLRGETDDRF